MPFRNPDSKNLLAWTPRNGYNSGNYVSAVRSCEPMSDMFFELQEQLTPALRAGNLEYCERRIAESLRGLPDSPFHIVSGLAITNKPQAVAAYFDEFFFLQPRHLI